MAFYGCQFSFNGVPCSEYGLMLYNVGSISEDGTFTSGGKIQEDRTVHRSTPLHYGVTKNNPLSFTLTFGANLDSIDENEHIDRWEMNEIANWLTGHDDYKYLEIQQPDMEEFRYKCIITDLKYITYGKTPWAFEATVTCDSPYAYMYPQTFTYTITNEPQTIQFRNMAATKYYYPKIRITETSGNGGKSITIKNASDNNRQFSLSGISASATINIDNDNEIITNNDNLNLYDTFNYKFFRLIKGTNEITITGSNLTVEIICEFPVNIGG